MFNQVRRGEPTTHFKRHICERLARNEPQETEDVFITKTDLLPTKKLMMLPFSFPFPFPRCSQTLSYFKLR